MSIQRYDRAHWADEGEMFKDNAGPWVKYDDHVAEVARLTRELDEMRAMWDKDSTARQRLSADLATVRAERDGLAKALEAIAAIDYTRGATNGAPYKAHTSARAALAALPTAPKEDDRELAEYDRRLREHDAAIDALRRQKVPGYEAQT